MNPFCSRFFVFLLFAVPTLVVADPAVSNLAAQQRAGTHLVDINYDLAAPGFTAMKVSLEISSNAGGTWVVPVNSASGAIGAAVTPGSGKTIVWDAGADWNGNFSSQMRFRVTADDGFPLIPAGSFTMGRTSGDTDSDAPPVSVTLAKFYIQATETTKSQWDEVRTWALAHGYTDLPVGGGKAANHPVHSVTWWDVVKWCNARSEKESLTPVYTVSGAVMRTGTAEPTVNWSANGYRLPTEAEWEKAARGGVTGKRFPWATDTISHAQANYYGSSSNAYDQSPINNYHPSYRTGGFAYTSPVGSFGANQYGLYDMAGNVWEWSWDRYGSSYYTTSNGTTDPRGPASGTGRVLRGGGWGDSAVRARCAVRQYFAPGYTGIFLGFRPARIETASGSALTANVVVDTRSNNADLGGLTLTGVTLSPGFGSNTMAYEAVVAFATTQVTVRPEVADSRSTVLVRINGGSSSFVASGSNSAPLGLNVGNNSIEVRVVAQNGITEKTYVVRVNREATVPLVVSPSVTSITATSAVLGGNVSYDGGSGITERGVVYSPTLENGNPEIDGPGVVKRVIAGTTGIFSEAVGGLNNAVHYTFKAFATNSKGTSYSATQTFVPLSDNANLGGLLAGVGSLDPVFSESTSGYTLTVDNLTTSITFAPTLADGLASVTVNDLPVTSGSPSGALPLLVGNNSVIIKVKAQNGSERSYTVNVIRLGTPTVTGPVLVAVAMNRATLSGNVVNVGSGTFLRRGMVISTTATPTFANGLVFAATTLGAGVYSVEISGLAPGTRYLARTYAENSEGVSYGDEMSFITDTPVSFGPNGTGSVENRQILAGESQRFRFTIGSPKSLSSFLANPGSGIEMKLYDESGALLASSADGNLERVLAPGVYEIEVNNPGTSPVTFTLNLDSGSDVATEPRVTVFPAGLTSRRWRPVVTVGKIRNLGIFPDAMKVQASNGNRFFRVSYTQGTNVTAAVVAGTHQTGIIGNSDLPVGIQIIVSPNRRTLSKGGKVVRKTFALTMIARSATPPSVSGSGSARIQTR